jgi:hypothetical protein
VSVLLLTSGWWGPVGRVWKDGLLVKEETARLNLPSSDALSLLGVRQGQRNRPARSLLQVLEVVTLGGESQVGGFRAASSLL